MAHEGGRDALEGKLGLGGAAFPRGARHAVDDARGLVLREGRPTALLERSEYSPETILEYASPGGATRPEFARLEVRA